MNQEIIDIINTFPNFLSLSNPGNNIEGNWENENNEVNKRGGKLFTLPENNCIALGLDVINKYGNDNDWLSCDGRKGEWSIAYHVPSTRLKLCDKLDDVIKNIIENNLKPGIGQAFCNHDDEYHPGKKIGVGVYCSPDYNVAKVHGGIIDIKGKKYRVIFMLRVKPDCIRHPNSSCYWILNGNFSEIRPYRLLFLPEH